jgi:TonB family protein
MHGLFSSHEAVVKGRLSFIFRPSRVLFSGSLFTAGLLVGCSTPHANEKPAADSQHPAPLAVVSEPNEIKGSRSAAQYNIGLLFEEGEIVPKDFKMAAVWYALAAAADNIEAINHLAALWRKGIPPKGRDYELALQLSRRAAALGDAEGQHDTADMLRYGRGAPKDPAEAFKLFCLAANQGDGYAAHKAGRMLSHGELGENNFTEARRWFDRAVELGHRDSMIEIGLQYFEGRGRPVDNKEAFIWFERAANAGADWAQNQVGSMLQLGVGVDRDDAKAVGWFQAAVKQKYPPAFTCLGSCYLTGAGVPKDPALAEDLYHQALALGEKNAAVYLVLVARTTSDREHRRLLLSEATQVLLEMEKAAGPPERWCLAEALLHDDNPLRDPAHGVRVLESMRQADPSVLLSLATYHLRTADWPAARECLEEAAAKNLPGATRFLGLASLLGIGAPVDEQRGANLLEQARDTRLIEKAFLYYAGTGVPRDESRALGLIKQAAREGNEQVQRTIAGLPDDQQLAAVFNPEPELQIRTPGTTSTDQRPPSLIEYCSPSYPEMARALEIVCVVTVEFTIDEVGRTTAVEIKGTPLTCFAEAAKAAIARWRFSPATRNGSAVSTRVTQTLKFNFQADPAQE